MSNDFERVKSFDMNYCNIIGSSVKYLGAHDIIDRWMRRKFIVI